ncbi:hypothetical protein B0H13DRAFT_1890974 [Mycena leptocephala]|nr:hypothetical protein B0H13DRAFT_1890974 [Mycena leptocephala]
MATIPINISIKVSDVARGSSTVAISFYGDLPLTPTQSATSLLYCFPELNGGCLMEQNIDLVRAIVNVAYHSEHALSPGGGGGGAALTADPNRPVPLYGLVVPTIDPKLKLNDLPTWDGNHDTAISYFWDIAQRANLGGDIPQALGFWLGMRLVEGSPIQVWYAGLPGAQQTIMWSHWILYLQTIKEMHLGYDGGPAEVYHIMEKAPISWGPILILENIPSTLILYSKMVEHEHALVNAWRGEESKGWSQEILAATLKSMGYTPERQRSTPRQVHLSSVQEEGEIHTSAEEELTFGDSNDEQVLKQFASTVEPTEEETMYQSAFTVLLNEALSSSSVDYSSLGGASFFEKASLKSTISGYKTTELAERERRTEQGAASKSDTFPSQKNLNREPFSINAGQDNSIQDNRNREMRNSSTAHIVEIPDEEDEASKMKPKATSGILESAEDDEKGEEQLEEVETRRWNSQGRAKQVSGKNRIAELFWLNDSRMFADAEGMGEESDGENEGEDLEAEKEAFISERRADQPEADVPRAKQDPAKETLIRLFKRRKTKAGRLALGTSVLSMRGSVGSVDTPMIDLRLDTCANITLISQDYYNSIPNRAPIRAGIPMKLVQLTQEESGIQGFTVVPIFVISEEGEVLETEAEAYVVPGMSILILLGEDYQLNYELALTRNIETGTHIHFQNWEYTVRAQSVKRTSDYGRILFSNHTISKHAKAKLHHKKLVHQRRKTEKFGEEKRTVQAAHDYRIRAHECRSILVEGHFEDDKEWLVEKSLLANANDSFFAVPNTLISSINPWVPISNPTDQTRMIRKGEAIGMLTDPQEFFDKPNSNESKEKLQRSAQAIALLIKANVERESAEQAHLRHTESLEVGCSICYPEREKPENSETVEEPETKPATNEEEEEDYGPKTAAMPDPE